MGRICAMQTAHLEEKFSKKEIEFLQRRMRRIWYLLMATLVLIVIVGTVVLFQYRFTPGPFSLFAYVGTLLINAAVPLMVGWSASRHIEQMDDRTAMTGCVLAWTQPTAGLLSWLATTTLFVAVWQGWKSPAPALLLNGCTYYIATFVLGLLFGYVLQIVTPKLMGLFLLRKQAKMKVVR